MKYFLDTEFHDRKITLYLDEETGMWSDDPKGLDVIDIDTIELISIGIVTEDGRELYMVNKEFDVEAACDNEWLNKNVMQPLYNSFGISSRCPYDPDSMYEWIQNNGHTKKEIALAIANLVKFDNKAEFWAYYNSYDWVVVNSLFKYAFTPKDGVTGMSYVSPKGMPWFCHDLQQEFSRLNIKRKDIPVKNKSKHSALEDARWNKAAHEWLIKHQFEISNE